MTIRTLSHRFVENAPDALEDGVLYVSITHATVIHKCCCGCGEEVVTPLSPSDWQLTFDGKAISLYPSIGNWSYECRSHYWIKRNKASWAEDWSKEKIDYARAVDARVRAEYYSAMGTPAGEQASAPTPTLKPTSRWARLFHWFTGA
jgi:hypothetical protein